MNWSVTQRIFEAQRGCLCKCIAYKVHRRYCWRPRCFCWTPRESNIQTKSLRRLLQSVSQSVSQSGIRMLPVLENVHTIVLLVISFTFSIWMTTNGREIETLRVPLDIHGLAPCTERGCGPPCYDEGCGSVAGGATD